MRKKNSSSLSSPPKVSRSANFQAEFFPQCAFLIMPVLLLSARSLELSDHGENEREEGRPSPSRREAASPSEYRSESWHVKRVCVSSLISYTRCLGFREEHFRTFQKCRMNVRSTADWVFPRRKISINNNIITLISL